MKEFATKIDAYNLQWRVYKDHGDVVLRLGTLQLVGEPFYDLAFGSCLFDFAIITNKGDYRLKYPTRFYSEQLEPLVYKPEHVNAIFHKKDLVLYQYYNILRGQRYNMYSTPIDDDMGTKQLRYLSPHLTVTTKDGNPLLLIDYYLYSKLPETWTLQDIVDVLKDELEQQKKLHEQLWYDIADAYAKHKPLKIPIEYNDNRDAFYTEEINEYGIRTPKLEHVFLNAQRER